MEQTPITIIMPERTAISNGISKSAVELHKHINIFSDVLDYGSGKLRNAYFLSEQGYKVSTLDTPLQMEFIADLEKSMFQSCYTIHDNIPYTYDAILCSYVLNVIPFMEERDKVMKNIYRLLKQDGYLFVEVRKKDGNLKAKHHQPFEDGYLIGQEKVKIFQKPYEREAFISYVLSFGFSVKSVFSTSDSWMIIAKKEEVAQQAVFPHYNKQSWNLIEV